MLKTCCATPFLAANATREGRLHKYERLGFSSPPGTLCAYATFAIWLLASASLLPSVATARSAAESLGRPSGLSSDRRRCGKLDHGGARRAREKDEHGVASHMACTSPLLIHPRMVLRTVGRVRSHQSPRRMSIPTAGCPIPRKARAIPPAPSNMSRQTVP